MIFLLASTGAQALGMFKKISSDFQDLVSRNTTGYYIATRNSCVGHRQYERARLDIGVLTYEETLESLS